jgi:hypothetical protein
LTREIRHDCVIPAQLSDMTNRIEARFARGTVDAYGHAYEAMPSKRVHQMGFAHLSGDRSYVSHRIALFALPQASLWVPHQLCLESKTG